VRFLAPLMFAVLACGSPSPPPPHEYQAGDPQNGQTLSVHTGDTIRLTLDSTAWTVAGSSDSSVLEQVGSQVVSPAPPGACVAGQGCGTTAAVFRALTRGTATIGATRVSCGEARLCVGAEGRYEVKVSVG
jgi:hypothetical protein